MIWCGQHMLYFRPQFALSHTQSLLPKEELWRATRHG
jgi:hypothetical protein